MKKNPNRRSAFTNVEYWDIHTSVRLFVRTAHSFSCSALLASLARSAALIRSLARSLAHSRAHGKAVFVYELNALISYSLKPLCNVLSLDRNSCTVIQDTLKIGQKHPTVQQAQGRMNEPRTQRSAFERVGEASSVRRASE